MLRRSTSAPIISVMTRSSTPATVSMPSSRRPYHCDSFLIKSNHLSSSWSRRFSLTRPAHHRLPRLLEQFLELRSGGGTEPDDAVPSGLIGFGNVGACRVAFEADCLDAGGGLTLGLPLVLLCERRD